MKYKVVFRGKVDNDFSLDDILENVSNLFDQTPEEIYQELFEKPQSKYIFIKGLSNEDAQEYQAALLEAGIVADIDIDFDIEADVSVVTPPVSKTKTIKKPSNSPIMLDVDAEYLGGLDDYSSKTLQIDTAILEKIEASTPQQNDIRERFLETKEFTLVDNEKDVVEIETNRVEKLKKIAKRHETIEIDERESVAIPPYFHSGVRIGRVRFIYRIILALALVAISLNIVPVYLVKSFGDSGYYFSFLIIIVVFMFVLMVISQRFCDFEEMTIARSLSVAAVLGILFFSMFVHNYYIILDSAIDFSKSILTRNNMGDEYFELEKILNNYLLQLDDQIILKRVDSYVKWITYVIVFIGGIVLLLLSGVDGNNQYGQPSSQIALPETLVFIVSLFLFIIGFSYPYSSQQNKFENRLYKTEFYEYVGLLKPLPEEFQVVYKDYLKKNSTKSQ